MSDTDQETTPDDELGRISDTFTKVKEFLEVTRFNFGGSTRASEDSPTRKTTLTSWTNYYQSLVKKPGYIVQKLYPAINQCEILDAETLKREKPQLVWQLNSLKFQFDKEFQTLIKEISSIPQEVLLRGFIGEPTQH